MLIAIQLLAGIALLYYGAEWLVKGGVGIAARLGIPPLIIGLTLVSFATSAPELVVSVKAALAGSGDISIGNVVGSNICNVGLILGLSALITPLAEAMPLSRGAGCWARRVLERRDYERKQTAQAIKDAGFDVSDQVKFLERLYLGEEN